MPPGSEYVVRRVNMLIAVGGGTRRNCSLGRMQCMLCAGRDGTMSTSYVVDVVLRATSVGRSRGNEGLYGK